MHVIRNFDLPLRLAARKESGVDLRKNFAERHRNLEIVAIRLRRKNIRTSRTQFSKGHPHSTASELRHDAPERESDKNSGDVRL